MSVKIQFKKLHPDASVPEKATPGSAGWDVRALESGGIGVGETVLVRTGIAVAIPMGYEIQTRPRSGLAVKKGSPCSTLLRRSTRITEESFSSP